MFSVPVTGCAVKRLDMVWSKRQLGGHVICLGFGKFY